MVFRLVSAAICSSLACCFLLLPAAFFPLPFAVCSLTVAFSHLPSASDAFNLTVAPCRLPSAVCSLTVASRPLPSAVGPLPHSFCLPPSTLCQLEQKPSPFAPLKWGTLPLLLALCHLPSSPALCPWPCSLPSVRCPARSHLPFEIFPSALCTLPRSACLLSSALSPLPVVLDRCPTPSHRVTPVAWDSNCDNRTSTCKTTFGTLSRLALCVGIPWWRLASSRRHFYTC